MKQQQSLFFIKTDSIVTFFFLSSYQMNCCRRQGQTRLRKAEHDDRAEETHTSLHSYSRITLKIRKGGSKKRKPLFSAYRPVRIQNWFPFSNWKVLLFFAFAIYLWNDVCSVISQIVMRSIRKMKSVIILQPFAAHQEWNLVVFVQMIATAPKNDSRRLLTNVRDHAEK